MGSFFSKNKNPNAIYEPKPEKNLLGNDTSTYAYNAIKNKNFYSLCHKLCNSNDISMEYFDIPLMFWLGIYATIFTSQSECTRVFLTCSKTLPDANIANVEAIMILPVLERPEATPIIFCSAIPTSKNLSGNSLAKRQVLVERKRSASMYYKNLL